MKMAENKVFYTLMRVGLRINTEASVSLPPEEWQEVLLESRRQSLIGLIWSAIQQLNCENQIPVEMALRWYGEVEKLHDMNQVLNDEAARLTRLFGEQGRQTAILKGQANARLYVDRLVRQPGDIDIWVSGGKKSVLELLEKMGLMSEHASTSYHHTHLPTNERGVDVEIHFRPSSGNQNPFSNHRLQKWLEKEILASTTQVEEGFFVPSIPFALVMQLSHIQRHYLSGGIGFRQLCDYYILLTHSTEEERRRVSSQLKRLGLRRSAGALMWLLAEVLDLSEELMLCKPDSFRGPWMLDEVLKGGNFGFHAPLEHHGHWGRFLLGRCRQFRLLRFDAAESFWTEVRHYLYLLQTLPTRIRHRSWSLRDIQT